MLEKKVENTVTGLEIVTEKAVEINKEEFFNMLSSAPEGITLTVDRIGKTFKSKWQDKQGNYPSGCFIDYSFTYNETDYSVGISYNLGVPVAEETFILKSGSNLFKILEIVVDISRAEEVKVTKEFLEETLAGITFKAKVGAGFNGFIIKPVELIED